MRMKVVAEGTQTKEIWDALTRLDGDQAQGYSISAPLPAHEFPGRLDDSPWQPAPACSENQGGPTLAKIRTPANIDYRCRGWLASH
jgi:predicted signal transduction protein with EAL and GGDEF domain